MPTASKRVYRVAAAGGEPACMTCAWRETADVRAGELSPSGEHLAFLSGLMGPRADLYVAHLPSGRLRKVTNQADVPRWSPDGRHLLFISNRDGQADLWEQAIDPDGAPAGEPRKITSALGATTFALAPDGKQILAVKEESSSHLWSVPLSMPTVTDLGSAIQLTSGNVRDQRGRWSADGRSIFFESVRRGGFDIWRVDVAGGNPVRLTTGAGSELRPRPSPSGEWIAFDLVDARGEFTHVMRPDGSQLRALDERWFSTFGHVCCADWSPDGSRLNVTVTTRDSPAKTTLAIVSFDKSSGVATGTRVLTNLPGGAPEYGRWSPDGRAIVYEALIDGGWDLWIVDPDAPAPRPLTTAGGNDRHAVWQAAAAHAVLSAERARGMAPARRRSQRADGRRGAMAGAAGPDDARRRCPQHQPVERSTAADDRRARERHLAGGAQIALAGRPATRAESRRAHRAASRRGQESRTPRATRLPAAPPSARTWRCPRPSRRTSASP